MRERLETTVAAERLDGCRRGSTSSRMTAKPVGHCEEGAVGEIPILVLVAVQANVAGRPEVEAHARMLVVASPRPGFRDAVGPGTADVIQPVGR